MSQNQFNEQIIKAQSKASEAAQLLGKLTVDNAKVLAQINQAAAKDALLATQAAGEQLLAIKEPKQLEKAFQSEVLQDAAQDAAKYAVAYQAKVSEVLRDGANELISVVNASVSDARDSLVKSVNEVSKSAPAGAEQFVAAFKTVFDFSIQQFDQARSASASALAGFEKSVDAAAQNTQLSFAELKSYSKSRKAA